MRQKDRAVNIGTASLILVFTVLALVTFALLSLSSASAQRRLAEKMAERTAQYYEAEARAARILGNVGEILDEIAADSDRDTFAGKVEAAVNTNMLSGEDLSEGVYSDGVSETVSKPEIFLAEGLLCWQIPVSEKQQLEIQIRPVFPETKGQKAWELMKWQMVGTEEWENRQEIQLYR